MLDDLISQSVRLLLKDKMLKDVAGSVAYFSEYRTLTLGVPRRSGKTVAIRNRICQNDVLFVHHEQMRNDYREKMPNFPSHQIVNFSSDSSIQSLIHNTGGFSSKPENLGLNPNSKFASSTPIGCFFIDEYEYMSKNTWVDILNIAGRLDIQGKLTPEFYILRLGT